MPTNNEEPAERTAEAVARFWASLLPASVEPPVREHFEATLYHHVRPRLDPLMVSYTSATRSRDCGALNWALHTAGLEGEAQEWFPREVATAATTARLTIRRPGEVLHEHFV